MPSHMMNVLRDVAPQAHRRIRKLMNGQGPLKGARQRARSNGFRDIT